MFGQIMSVKLCILVASLVIAIFTTACGGGGGGGGASSTDDAPTIPEPPMPPPSPPEPAETFSLSGTISTSSGQSVDSDTNDPNQRAISNDDPGLAQSIQNPVTLGGYINVPGSGAAGRSAAAGDIDDFFQVELLRGQRVTLLVAEFEAADADLYLLDSEGIQVANSLSSGEIESLLVPEDGDYFVVIHAYEGATNYTLVIGSAGSSAQNNLREHKVIPWEAVVTYKDNTQQLGGEAQTKEMSRALGMQQRAGGRGRGRLMTLGKGLTRAAQRNPQPLSWASNIGMINDPALQSRSETLMAIKSLRNDPRVLYAEPNFQVKALAAPNDEAYSLQWHYPLIALPDAWEISTGNPGVVVAVVDTGILSGHPDLVGQQVDGYDFVSNSDSAMDGDGLDSDPEDPGLFLSGGSGSFHGTHVSGTVAAGGNNRRGVAGVAYGARVMPLRALGADGSGTSYDINQAVRYAAGLANDSGTVPQQRADIINLSLGGADFSQATQDLYDAVRAAGVIVVAAAGNEANSSSLYPAAYRGVISVSAVDGQRQLAPYSNAGPDVDVAAPGGDSSVDFNGDGYPDAVLSTDGNVDDNGVSYTYSFLSGTSMAAPHVSGVLALMKSVNSALTPADIDALLASGALTEDLGAPGRDDLFGHGIINAQLSVLAALDATGNSPADRSTLTASTNALNFGNGITTLRLLLRNGGKGDLTLENLSVSASWLQVTAVQVDGAGLGEYEVTVNRDGLTPGIYAADITAQSSENNLAVRVLVSQGGANAGTGVGVIYVLLYDPVQDDVVAQFSAEGNGADYMFRFTNIAPGRYEIIAGTDADNDLVICDTGEACGAWLTTDQPIQVELQDNLEKLNFPVEYRVSLPAADSNKQSSIAAGVRRALKNQNKKEDQTRRVKAQ